MSHDVVTLAVVAGGAGALAGVRVLARRGALAGRRVARRTAYRLWLRPGPPEPAPVRRGAPAGRPLPRGGPGIRLAGSWPALTGAIPPARRSPRLLRYDLRCALTRAEQAVGLADAGGAAVGDLPGLLARLRRLSAAEDAALAVLAGTSPAALAEARRRVARLVRLAGEVQAAAVAAHGAAAAPPTADLARDVALEVAAVRAAAGR